MSLFNINILQAIMQSCMQIVEGRVKNLLFLLFDQDLYLNCQQF